MGNVITYPEMARQHPEGSLKRGVISMFAEASDILSAIPFMNAPTGTYSYQHLTALPDNLGFRALNEEPGKGHGVVSDYTERTYPLAGNMDMDRLIVKRAEAAGNDRRTTEIQGQATRASQIWTDKFFTGDNGENPREPTGLQLRLQSPEGTGASKYDGTFKRNRIFDNAKGVSGGAPLDLTQLDTAIALTNGCTHIIMNWRLRSLFAAARRDSGVLGNAVRETTNEAGMTTMSYAGKTILIGYEPDDHPEVLPFNETAIGGGAAATSSIYLVNFNEGRVCGLQDSAPEVNNIGLTEGGVFERINYEHAIGFCIEHGYSAVRLSGITKSAVIST